MSKRVVFVDINNPSTPSNCYYFDDDNNMVISLNIKDLGRIGRMTIRPVYENGQ